MNTVTGSYRTRPSASGGDCVQSYANSKSATNSNLVVTVILVIVVVVMLFMRFFVAPTAHNTLNVAQPTVSLAAGSTQSPGAIAPVATGMTHDKKAKVETGFMIALAVGTVISLGTSYWSRSAVSQLGTCV
jgi:hypothetical protein